MSRLPEEDGISPGDGTVRRPARIRLLPLQPDPPAHALLDWLARKVSERLGVEVEVDPPIEPEGASTSGEGAQLSSEAIVDFLIDRYPAPRPRDPEVWTVAITRSDLVGGGRDFVFGEATQGGYWALVATARFGAAGTAEFRPRLLKETLHEIGHLAGLPHCAREGCIMAPAPDVREVDRKSMEFCEMCRPRVGQNRT